MKKNAHEVAALLQSLPIDAEVNISFSSDEGYNVTPQPGDMVNMQLWIRAAYEPSFWRSAPPALPPAIVSLEKPAAPIALPGPRPEALEVDPREAAGPLAAPELSDADRWILFEAEHRQSHPEIFSSMTPGSVKPSNDEARRMKLVERSSGPRDLVALALFGFAVAAAVMGPYAVSQIAAHRAAFIAERPLSSVCPPHSHLAGWYDEDRGDGLRHDRDVCVAGPAARPIHWRTPAEAEQWIASSGLHRSRVIIGTAHATPEPTARAAPPNAIGTPSSEWRDHLDAAAR